LNITFFPDNVDLVKQPRGFHIHEFGITELNQDPSVTCGSAGGHWNPSKSQHPTHAGDLGNVVVTPVNGKILTKLTTSKLQLSGVESIIGRSVVLHEKTDDMGRGTNEASKTNGNAGSRIACGTIGYVKP
jgi:Cu/Zn superoxide dismutase